jgi:hypothetical protein
MKKEDVEIDEGCRFVFVYSILSLISNLSVLSRSLYYPLPDPADLILVQRIAIQRHAFSASTFDSQHELTLIGSLWNDHRYPICAEAHVLVCIELDAKRWVDI